MEQGLHRLQYLCVCSASPIKTKPGGLRMMRKVFCGIALLAAISFAFVRPVAAQQDRATGNRQLTQQEKDFLNTAYMDNMTEVEEGKVAQQKSDNRQIKQFGEMLATDH